jgi:hypothetical protein
MTSRYHGKKAKLWESARDVVGARKNTAVRQPRNRRYSDLRLSDKRVFGTKTRWLLACEVHGAAPFWIKAERDARVSRKLESAQSDFRIDTFAQGKDLKASAKHFRMQ